MHFLLSYPLLHQKDTISDTYCRYKATYLILDNDSKFLKEVFNTKFNWKKEKFLEEDVLVENVYPHIKYLIKRDYNFDNFI